VQETFKHPSCPNPQPPNQSQNPKHIQHAFRFPYSRNADQATAHKSQPRQLAKLYPNISSFASMYQLHQYQHQSTINRHPINKTNRTSHNIKARQPLPRNPAGSATLYSWIWKLLPMGKVDLNDCPPDFHPTPQCSKQTYCTVHVTSADQQCIRSKRASRPIEELTTDTADHMYRIN
jgi:hypothetical protein